MGRSGMPEPPSVTMRAAAEFVQRLDGAARGHRDHARLRIADREAGRSPSYACGMTTAVTWMLPGASETVRLPFTLSCALFDVAVQ